MYLITGVYIESGVLYSKKKPHQSLYMCIGKYIWIRVVLHNECCSIGRIQKPIVITNGIKFNNNLSIIHYNEYVDMWIYTHAHPHIHTQTHILYDRRKTQLVSII